MLQSGPELLVRVAVDGVQVESQRAGEEDGVLGDDGDPRPQLAQAQVRDVHLVYLNGASRRLHDPEGILLIGTGLTHG